MTSYYKSYDTLMNHMLSTLPDNVDRREGSVIYTCFSAAAMLIAMLSDELEEIYANAYPDTAEGEYLERVAQIVGIERNPPTKAVAAVKTNSPIPIGSVFIIGDFKYTITSMENGYYLAECSTSGSEANSYTGALMPEKEIEGLVSAEITKIVAMGKDAESDQSLRERLLDRLKYPVCAGNMSYYRENLKAMSGVGGVKVIPATQEESVVKLIITDTAFKVPSDELISYVQESIDPIATSGRGYGIAPIGQKVKVSGVKKVDVALNVRITTDGATPSVVAQVARQTINAYAMSLNKDWAKSENMVLRNRGFEDFFLNLNGVKDIEILSINGEANRLILNADEIIGEVTVNLSD